MAKAINVSTKGAGESSIAGSAWAGDVIHGFLCSASDIVANDRHDWY